MTRQGPVSARTTDESSRGRRAAGPDRYSGPAWTGPASEGTAAAGLADPSNEDGDGEAAECEHRDGQGDHEERAVTNGGQAD